MEQLKRFVVNLDEKVTKTQEDTAEIKVALAEIQADLKYHIKRTDLSEERIEVVEEKLLPLVELKYKFDGAFLLAGKVCTGLGLIFAAVKAIETVLQYI